MQPKRYSLIHFSFTLLCLSQFAESSEARREEPSLNDYYTPFSSESNYSIPATFTSSSSNTTGPGHLFIEPYLYFTSTFGYYDKNWKSHSQTSFYSLNPQTYVWVGLTSFLDLWIMPQVFYQFTKNQHSTQFGDLPIGFDIQILTDTPGTWHPSTELSIQATIPLGKYKNLNQAKLDTDSVGTGSFLPSLSLSSSKLFLLSNNHYLEPRLSFNYSIPTSVSVKNLNAYGGVLGTRGTIFPGNIFTCDLGFEYSLTLRWALACDIFYEHVDKTTFKGTPGKTLLGTSASIGHLSSEQISIAPSLEYNINSSMGFTGGFWISLMGRNSSRFATGVLSFTIYL